MALQEGNITLSPNGIFLRGQTNFSPRLSNPVHLIELAISLLNILFSSPFFFSLRKGSQVSSDEGDKVKYFRN